MRRMQAGCGWRSRARARVRVLAGPWPAQGGGVQQDGNVTVRWLSETCQFCYKRHGDNARANVNDSYWNHQTVALRFLP